MVWRIFFCFLFFSPDVNNSSHEDVKVSDVFTLRKPLSGTASNLVLDIFEDAGKLEALSRKAN